ncbi:type IV pilus assembly protein PilM [Stieleria varia]|uniref:Competence protein A n=1 Tax=Stieleria varia TaxID=2528005 RepID=A0A5C6APA7_9BACT|nr:type IV pilus assembly protein PilM [Stieleria varia]TWU01109.1 Competence protein A [Stieleria varia]
MANSSSVWGIEIGQSALKALRCSIVDGEIVADAFDYIEYPKILSQPEAVPEELIADALLQLLERNDGLNEKVCISVPGQSGLAKFFKPPPVEVKKIADLVRYEARQQIPFDLNDVVWDYQMMPGSMVEEGYALESEVGLFAMKRDQAYRQLAPFDRANVEVDVVQLAPVALYNMVAYDRMNERLESEMFDADNPPPSSVLLSIGTDSSDLIVTNGFRIWQRSMPIGGNHFTRQLTKDLKMTFAKAEHLKRNAREAVDPKLIFQTMRPVFNDLVTEVQRSIGFFRSIHKKAEISELLITGNTVKMPGLAAYLGKNLGFEVHVLDRFNRLGGDDVLSIPTFRDNATTFAVCYGLCLQGLGVSQMDASLIPQEIKTARMIRAKKPWTIAALAALLIGMTGNYFFVQSNWRKTHPDKWSRSFTAVSTATAAASEHREKDKTLDAKLTYLNKVGEEIAGDRESRLTWMEVIDAINQLIPRFETPDGKPLKNHVDRKDFYITQFDTKFYEDLKTDWYTELLASRFKNEMTDWYTVKGKPLPAEPLETLYPGPEGKGWVIELRGYHYYNSEDRIGERGSDHVRKYFTNAFFEGEIQLPDPRDPAKKITFTPQQFGFSYPLMLNVVEPVKVKVENPDFDPDLVKSGVAAGMRGMAAQSGQDKDPAKQQYLEVPRHDFVFQLVWQPNLFSERVKVLEEEAAAAAEAAEAEKAAQAAADDSVAMN